MIMKIASFLSITITAVLSATEESSEYEYKSQPNQRRQEGSIRKLQAKKTKAAFASSNEDDSTLVPPEEMCMAFRLFEHISKDMEKANANFEWSNACAPFRVLNYQICPDGKYLEDICTDPPYKTDLNPSVRYEYCEPVFSRGIDDPKDRDDCVRACIKYVSRDRGDCCEFKCPVL